MRARRTRREGGEESDTLRRIVALGRGRPRWERVSLEANLLGVKPWRFAPSYLDADDDESPWPSSCVGESAWERAQWQRLEIKRLCPDYFPDDDETQPKTRPD